MSCGHGPRRSRAERHRAWAAERELWHRDPHRSQWMPWWLHARMRWRIFFSLAVALGAGMLIGARLDSHPRWWQIVLTLLALSAASGAIAWRLTRPLIMAVR